jgi:hypothetical protein
MTNNYKKLLFIAVLMLSHVVWGSAIYAQKPGREKSVKIAAAAFYKKYLPQFGYPSQSELRRLRPLLSGSLYSLIKYEMERMKTWTAKNPNDKPPVSEDLFLCNHDEPATNFRVGKVTFGQRAATAVVYFDYAENKKIYATCQIESSFIRVGGKWLLDNVVFEKGVDLQDLLSRKEYDVLPN